MAICPCLKRLRDRVPELLALLLGALLRLSMATTYDVRRGFDFAGHWVCADYIARHGQIPPLVLSAASYHPPLYYLVLAAMIKIGLGIGAAGWLAALLGTVRLVVVWVGLERWLPESRLARVIALFTSALLPCGVQIDGMVSNETLSTLLCALVMVALPAAVEGARSGRVKPAAWLGLWLGLALLTKFSATVFILALVPAVAWEIFRLRARQPLLAALRARWKPYAVAASIALALSGWFYVRNQRLYGQLAPTAFEGMLKPNQEPFEKIPYLERRAPDFFWGWDPQIFTYPYVPAGYWPRSKFFSVLVASTFSDYYSYALANWRDGVAVRFIAHRPIPLLAFNLSCLSMCGGTFIALLTLLAWLGAAKKLRDRPDDPRAVLLLVPLLAVLGHIHFATKYPNNDFGPIKGHYMQFVAPVFCALFGLAVAWMWRRVRTRAGAVAAVAALALVAVYIVDCRRPYFGRGATRAAPFLARGPSSG
ncbi:MAG TPA: glycosyltransferase family 39 protein [Polyangia bacterium]|jgi:hypothetical protein|nr:glycosyltransferase family 39 protein [Polyangia bacterium]